MPRFRVSGVQFQNGDERLLGRLPIAALLQIGVAEKLTRSYVGGIAVGCLAEGVAGVVEFFPCQLGPGRGAVTRAGRRWEPPPAGWRLLPAPASALAPGRLLPDRGR